MHLSCRHAGSARRGARRRLRPARREPRLRRWPRHALSAAPRREPRPARTPLAAACPLPEPRLCQWPQTGRTPPPAASRAYAGGRAPSVASPRTHRWPPLRHREPAGRAHAGGRAPRRELAARAAAPVPAPLDLRWPSPRTRPRPPEPRLPPPRSAQQQRKELTMRMEGLLYSKVQEGKLFALHRVNTALQGPFFSVFDISPGSPLTSTRELPVMLEASRSPGAANAATWDFFAAGKGSHKVSLGGDFSIQVGNWTDDLKSLIWELSNADKEIKTTSAWVLPRANQNNVIIKKSQNNVLVQNQIL